MNDIQAEFAALVAKYTREQVLHEADKLRRQRVPKGREPRQKFSREMYMTLHTGQKGVCACGCKEMLLYPSTKNHIDHFDPNLERGFNHRRNLALLLPACNLKKGSKDVVAYAKEKGITVLEAIKQRRTTE